MERSYPQKEVRGHNEMGKQIYTIPPINKSALRNAIAIGILNRIDIAVLSFIANNKPSSMRTISNKFNLSMICVDNSLTKLKKLHYIKVTK